MKMKRTLKMLSMALVAVVAALAPFRARADWYAFEYPVITMDEDGPGTIVPWSLVRNITDGTGVVPHEQIQFEIWRDGAHIDTVTGGNSYRDLGAVAGEVNKYRVKALGAWSQELSLRCYGSYHFWIDKE